MQREDQRRRLGIELRGQRGVVRRVEPGDPRAAGLGWQHIAGDRVPVAGLGHRARGVVLAVDVADQPAEAALEGGKAGPLGQPRANLRHADVHRHVLVQQGRGDAQINVGGHMVRGVVRDHQNAAEARRAEQARDRGHRSAPPSDHHPLGSPACAASRSAGVA